MAVNFRGSNPIEPLKVFDIMHLVVITEVVKRVFRFWREDIGLQAFLKPHRPGKRLWIITYIGIKYTSELAGAEANVQV